MADLALEAIFERDNTVTALALLALMLLACLALDFSLGAYCVACCSALMLLLFVGGVMNLVWIAGLSLLVLV
jgi:Predicted metal-binding integral membrane protein (DUF2182)